MSRRAHSLKYILPVNLVMRRWKKHPIDVNIQLFIPYTLHVFEKEKRMKGNQSVSGLVKGFIFSLLFSSAWMCLQKKNVSL